MPLGSRGHLAALELAGAPSVVIFASAYPNPPFFLPGDPPCCSSPESSWNCSSVPGRPIAVSDSACRGDSGGACRILQARGKHAVTASVKLVAEARICGWLAYSATFSVPLSLAHAGSHHGSPCTAPWVLMWEDSGWGREVQWSVSCPRTAFSSPSQASWAIQLI